MEEGYPTVYEGAPDLPLEPVYPEVALLLALLPAGRILNAWKDYVALMAEADNAALSEMKWTLGRYKSPRRWSNQLIERKWTPEEISNILERGEQFHAPNMINPGTATRYQIGKRFVVRDDQTQEILQVSGEGKFKPLMMPDLKHCVGSLYHETYRRNYVVIDMNRDLVEVYVQLLEEGTPTIRGTQAIEMGKDLYQLLPTKNYNPDDEIWEFLPGSIVQCEQRKNLGENILLAVRKVG